MAEITLDTIPTNGIHLHTAFAGPEDGPPVVLLHGFPEYWIGWEPQIHRLAAAGFRVIVPDQRGYNLSDKPTRVKPYYITHIVDDVTGLADALGIERFHLAGHDWGGIAAWWVALLHPERLNRLAVVNAPHPVIVLQSQKSFNPALLSSSWHWLAFQIPALPELVLKGRDWQTCFRFFFQRASHAGTFTEDDYTRYREAWSQPGAMTAMLNWYRAYARIGGLNPPGLPDDHQIRVPTLLLWGTGDAFVETSMAEPSMALVEDGAIQFYEAGHWVLHEKPEETSEALIGHFSG